MAAKYFWSAILILAQLIFAVNSFSTTIRGRVERKGAPLEYRNLHISINGGEFNGMVDMLGNFQIALPSAGLYKLEVLHMNYYFEPVVVEVHEEEFSPGKNVKAFLYSINSGKDFRLKYPLELEPSSRVAYFDERPPFDPLTYLKNPFVIMIGMTFFLSQMTKGMDKDDMKQA